MLQMINQPALKKLIAFNANPVPTHEIELLAIPALHNVLQFESKGRGTYSQALLLVCLWLETRALEVLATLTFGRSTPVTFTSQQEEQDWRKVSGKWSCFSPATLIAVTDRMLL